MSTLFLNEHRCQCGKLLFKGVIFDAVLEIKCKGCGKINKIGRIKMSNGVSQYLLIVNDKGIITNASDSACDILGYDCNELIGKHFTVINPSIPKEIGEKFFGPNSVLSEDQYFQFDTIHKTKKDKFIPIVGNYKLYKPNKKDRYVLISAKLKEKFNEKSDTDNTECDFVKKACDFHFDIDKNGIITFLDSSVEKIFGFSSNEAIGKSCFDFMPKEKVEENRKHFEYFSTKNQPYRTEGKIAINNKGEEVYIELYLTPKFNDGSKFIGYRVLGWIDKEKLQ